MAAQGSVMIVEDEVLIALDLSRRVAEQRYRVIGPARTLAEAFKLIGQNSLDCALLDIKLQDELIYPVADSLSTLGVPFIFVSGYSLSTMPAQHRDRPVVGKPIDYNRLLAELVDAMRLEAPA